MKIWIKIVVATIVFFVVYILLDYLFSQSIDWKMAITSSIIFAILEAVIQNHTNKKANK